MPAGLIRVFNIHRRSVASTKHNGGCLIAVQSGVDGNDTGCDGLPAVYLASMEWARLACRKFNDKQARLQLFALA